jgi:hypothetical protein
MQIGKIKKVSCSIFLSVTAFLASCEDSSPVVEDPHQKKQAEEVKKSSLVQEPQLGVKEYLITVQAIEIEGKKVELSISTNIPGNIEIMAGVSLMGQAPKDTYIGKSERVKVSNGNSEVIIDVSDLPTGEYEAEANFYPRWGLQDERSKLTGINHEISASQKIKIGGSGESSKLVAKRNEGQKWVMENIIVGTPWNASEWKERFGSQEELPVTSMNPNIIKNYYFSTIDMTVIVNILKVKVVTWRMGKDGA